MKWIYDYFDYIEGFPKPNWEEIYSFVEKNHVDDDPHEVWCGIAKSWCEDLAPRISKRAQLFESDNFILVTEDSNKFPSLYLPFLERTLKRITSSLPGIATDQGYGKFVVLVFEDMDKYYSYLSNYSQVEGKFALSSGVFLNRGYGHFAFPMQDINTAEGVAVHEMTHALVSHLPLPLWLNEGIAVNTESALTGFPPLRMDKKLFDHHERFWGESEIQEFWSGKSFSRPDEGSGLSYNLAQFAVHSLSRDYEVFVEFVNNADFSDAGEAAANEVYEGSLGNLIAQYFGEGEWTPDPTVWGWEHTNKSFKERTASYVGGPLTRR